MACGQSAAARARRFAAGYRRQAARRVRRSDDRVRPRRPAGGGRDMSPRPSPDSMEILWGAAVRYVLSAQVGGASVEEGLNRLLRG
jgi:hypothetical protein